MDMEPRCPYYQMNHNSSIVVGRWAVFPLFDSGTIAASDDLIGLVLMRLRQW